LDNNTRIHMNTDTHSKVRLLQQFKVHTLLLFCIQSHLEFLIKVHILEILDFMFDVFLKALLSS